MSGAPGSTPSDYSDEFARICGPRGVEGAARMFGVAPTAEDVAEAYAKQVPEGPDRDAAYEGCLQGFRDKR